MGRDKAQNMRGDEPRLPDRHKRDSADAPTLFPSLAPDEVAERIARRWQIRGGLYPMPRWAITCPVCWSQEIQLRHHHYHRRPGKSNPFRCDVSVKCCECSNVLVFGLVVTQEVYAKSGGRRHEWREVREAIEAEANE